MYNVLGVLVFRLSLNSAALDILCILATSKRSPLVPIVAEIKQLRCAYNQCIEILSYRLKARSWAGPVL